MEQRLVADTMVERLEAWGVKRVFGYSGDGINTFLGAMRRAENGPEFVQARHEESAAFMAVAHAKYGGGVGVVTATQGPGAVHLLNGLYDAKLDGVPVVAIVGQQELSVLGSQYQQEIDLMTLVKDVAARFSQQVSDPEQLPMVLDRAFRTALATSSPCVVVVPHDVQQMPAPELEREHGTVVTAPRFERPHVAPRRAELEAAAELLNAGRRVALLVGQGAAGARDEVEAVVRRLGAGVTTSLLGKPHVDETADYSTGVMGHLGTSASGWLMEHCDTLLIVGSNDPWTEFYPPPGAARAVQIDNDASKIGNRYPVSVGLVGDAAGTLAALLELLRPRTDGDWAGRVAQAVGDWHRLSAERAATPAEPVNPERVARELSDRLPADAQVAIDVGSCVYWYARQLRLPPGVPAHLSSTLASMGCGVPYGLAAKLLAPERPVVVLVGDGGMQMSGIAELVTVSRLWRQWADPRFVVCVLNNRDLAEVTWEQRETEGDPRYAASQDLPPFPFAGYADVLGLRGITVEDPELLGAAWDEAFESKIPVVLDVQTDASVPLLPPFPHGARKAETMRAGLRQEGASGERALRLLDTYVAQEERLFGDGASGRA